MLLINLLIAIILDTYKDTNLRSDAAAIVPSYPPQQQCLETITGLGCFLSVMLLSIDRQLDRWTDRRTDG